MMMQSGIRCFRCDKVGHKAKWCWWTTQQENRWKDVRCFGCGAKGHIVRYCEMRKRTATWEKENQKRK